MFNSSYTKQMLTPGKFNIDPENLPYQKEISLPTTIFEGLC